MLPEVRRVPLKTLFAEFPLAYSPAHLPDLPITGIAIDSRRVEAGNLFVARRGGALDGHEFIAAAIERGASAVVGERELSALPVPYIRVEDSIEAVTWLAAAFYDWPGRHLTVIGVTGTDGKTTTCNLLYMILQEAGLKTGMISTVNAVIGDEVLDTGFHVTTPDAPDVQFYLWRMLQAGLTHVILETTSHGLAQHRSDASQYDVAIFTNITHEHLDQHGSYEAYREAKGRLIGLLARTSPKPTGNPPMAVLNCDDASFIYLDELARRGYGPGPVRAVSYGLDASAEVRAEAIQYSPGGIQFDLVTKETRLPVISKLVGEFNVSNCLAAMTGAVYGLGINPRTAVQGVARLEGVPGRMERIDLGQGFTAIVDFAHTPNALRVAINTCRQMTNRRVITVFGSAGLRDKQKRRMMAETSAGLADISILTAEDPRTESLDGILEEMATGAISRGGVEGKTFFRVPDRGEAIRLGVHLAEPGDIVVACGKGHEQSMCFGTREHAWDDRTAMRAALAELLGIPGAQMPWLPTSKGGNG